MVCIALLCACRCFGQKEEAQTYSRKNTFTVFAEYANDSSHIILGRAPNRKIGGFGLRYERRLVSTPNFAFSYAAELRPVVLVSDPIEITTYTQTQPMMNSFTISGQTLQCIAGTRVLTPGVITETTKCDRAITYGSGFAPIGFRWSWRTRKQWQPTASANGGYLLTSRPIPIRAAGSFNFTFELGAGVEYFYRPHRSLRLEYQLQHISNHYTADANPGIDSGLFKLSYAFGR